MASSFFGVLLFSLILRKLVMSSFIFLVFIIIVISVLSSGANSSDSFLKWVREEEGYDCIWKRGYHFPLGKIRRLSLFQYTSFMVRSSFFLDVHLSLTLHDLLVLPLLLWSCYKHTCDLRGAAATAELALVSMFVEVRNKIKVQDTGQ